MEFKRRNRIRGKVAESTGFFSTDHGFQCLLQLYSKPPPGSISLQDFDRLALGRLKVLRAVESIGLKFSKFTKEYTEALKTTLQEAKADDIGIFTKGSKEEDRKTVVLNDTISHFILRLAYCKSEDLRRWFIQQESELFRFRLSLMNSTDLLSFLEANDLHYHPISEEEREELMEKLIASSNNPKQLACVTDFYKVPFEVVVDMVRKREIYLHMGFAYVPHSGLSNILCSLFRCRLSEDLTRASRRLAYIEDDSRLKPLMNNVTKVYFGNDYSKPPTGTEFTAEMIEMLSKESFPMCMLQMHQALHDNHHLRHNGRLQYGLFLKGIGLPLDQALKFWKTEFTRGTMDVDTFEKKYAYNVRYNYGKEGRKSNYTPYSCVKIITCNQPATGDHHGCPFKHCDKTLLRQKLQAQKIHKEGIDEILQLVETSNYQVACARQFELFHDAPKGSVNINHPNHYFEQSRLHYTEGSSQSEQTGGVILVPAKKESTSQSTHSQPDLSSQSTHSQPDLSSAETQNDHHDFEQLTQEEEDALFSNMDET